MADLSYNGSCLCGQVRFRVTAEPLITMACHCRGCQKLTSSAYSLSALTQEGAFEVTEGEPVIGGLHGPVRHFHCDWCKSWLFTRLEGGFVNVRTSMLDAAEAFPPFLESMTAEKLSWATTPAVHSYEGFPAGEEYPALMAAYAERERLS